MDPIKIGKDVLTAISVIVPAIGQFIANPVAGSIAGLVTALVPVVGKLLDIITAAKTDPSGAWDLVADGVKTEADKYHQLREAMKNGTPPDPAP